MYFKDLGTIRKCIYCGTTKEPLSDEHIIPYGLGGGYVLRKASCQKCADITSQFERNVLRYQFGPARAALNLPTRREHPKEFPLKIIKKSGKEETIKVPQQEYGGWKIFPVFPPPAYFVKRDNPNIIINWLVSGINLGNHLSKKYGARKISSRISCNPFDFARMIAKIAYGFSVAKFGLKKIKRNYVLSAICGESQDIGKWVGCSNPFLESTHFKKANPSSYADLAVDLEVKNSVIMARVRLFSREKAPTYLVVVGEVNQSFIEKIKEFILNLIFINL